MKISFISDVHLCFHIKKPYKVHKLIEKILPEEKGEVIIIAGDISHYNSLSFAFLKELKNHFKYVFATAGNHDLYLITKTQKNKYNKDSFLKLKELKEKCAKENIYFLNGETIEIEGVKITGLPGWYPVKNEKEWNRVLNDPKYIMKGFERIPIYDMYENRMLTSFNPNEYFKEQLKKLENVKQTDILFSHIPFVDLKEKHRNYSEYYWWQKDLSDYTKKIMKKVKVKLYIFGHVHENYDVVLPNGVRCISNYLGYKYKGQKIKTITI